MGENLRLALYDVNNSTNTNPTALSVQVVNNATGEIATSGTNISNGLWTPDGTGGTNNSATALNGNTAYNASNGEWYYSWYAATANSGTPSMVNDDALYSICPRGWRLPANYDYSAAAKTKSFGSLTNVYLNIAERTSTDDGYKTLESFPLIFSRIGYMNSGTHNDNGGGYSWSSTAYSTANKAYHLDFNTGNVCPQCNGHKLFGFPVRCVAV